MPEEALQLVERQVLQRRLAAQQRLDRPKGLPALPMHRLIPPHEFLRAHVIISCVLSTLVLCTALTSSDVSRAAGSQAVIDTPCLERHEGDSVRIVEKVDGRLAFSWASGRE